MEKNSCLQKTLSDRVESMALCNISNIYLHTLRMHSWAEDR
jgi:hypothetical protein